MTSDPTSLQFFKLLQLVQQGEATPEQHQELEQTLLSNPQARHAYYDALDVDQGLTEIASSRAVAPRRGLLQTAGRAGLARYLLVAAASLAVGAFLEWSLTGGLRGSGQVFEQRIAVSAPVPHFVATLVRSTDCDWGHQKSPFFEGQRLLSSDLELNRGVAEFRFETGVRLVLEGPTRLKIESDRAAMLEFGKVVLHGHEMADGFSLTTPQATLVDIGTEYGAVVDEKSNVEVHVFQGSVLVEPTKSLEKSDLVEAGGAKRFSEESVEDVKLRPELFQREVPGRTEHSSVSRDGMMSFDGFQSPQEGTSADLWQAGGTGWIGNWRRSLENGELAKPEVRSSVKLQFPQAMEALSGGALVLSPQKHIAWRTLQHPVQMDTDAIYYISFFMEKLVDLPPDKMQYGSLSLRTGALPRDNQRIAFGMSSQRLPILLHNEQQLQTAPPLQVGQSYFYVAKIVAGAETPDQVQMRVFSSEETIPEQEPHVWTCVSNPTYDNTVYDQVLLYTEGTEYAFDDIRVASSWQSAVNFNWPHSPAKPSTVQ